MSSRTALKWAALLAAGAIPLATGTCDVALDGFTVFVEDRGGYCCADDGYGFDFFVEEYPGYYEEEYYVEEEYYYGP